MRVDLETVEFEGKTHNDEVARVDVSRDESFAVGVKIVSGAPVGTGGGVMAYAIEEESIVSPYIMSASGSVGSAWIFRSVAPGPNVTRSITLLLQNSGESMSGRIYIWHRR